MFLKFPYICFVYIIAYRLMWKGKSLTNALLWTIIVLLIYRSYLVGANCVVHGKDYIEIVMYNCHDSH